jgi:hypothetical protein
LNDLYRATKISIREPLGVEGVAGVSRTKRPQSNAIAALVLQLCSRAVQFVLISDWKEILIAVVKRKEELCFALDVVNLYLRANTFARIAESQPSPLLPQVGHLYPLRLLGAKGDLEFWPSVCWQM